MNMDIIFRVLLNIAHFLYGLYYSVLQHWTCLVLFVQKRGYFLNKIQYDSNNHFTEASKIPRHLAILLGQEEISAFDLVKLISWCIVAEIPYISFYDHKGVLQKNQGFIKKKLHEIEPLLSQNIEWSNHLNKENGKIQTIVVTSTPTIGTTNTNQIISTKNGINKVKIQILSYTDGKDKIVAETKNLAEKIDSNNLQENDITSELLDEKLSLNRKIPDPDLAIVFGETMCTYGFLPWQSKITQFFVLPTHQDITLGNFLETLTKFSKCQQRYGK